MTDQQHLRLLALVNDLWKIAAPVGSMHSYWDVIMDIQAFTQGKPTIVQKTAEEWIEYAESLLTPNAKTVGPDAALSRQVPHE